MDINIYMYIYFVVWEDVDILLAKGASYLLHFGVLDREDHRRFSSVGWTGLRIRTVLYGQLDPCDNKTLRLINGKQTNPPHTSQNKKRVLSFESLNRLLPPRRSL